MITLHCILSSQMWFDTSQKIDATNSTFTAREAPPLRLWETIQKNIWLQEYRYSIFLNCYTSMCCINMYIYLSKKKFFKKCIWCYKHVTLCIGYHYFLSYSRNKNEFFMIKYKYFLHPLSNTNYIHCDIHKDILAKHTTMTIEFWYCVCVAIFV